jgi:hypothetical protein
MLIRTILIAAVFSLIACTSTGHRFDAARLAPLTPGVATYADVVNALGAPPSQIYRQADGSYLARWSHKTSVVNDGFYISQSVLLAFGSDHKLERLIDSNNVMLESWARTRLLGLTPAQPSEQHGGVAPAADRDQPTRANAGPAQVTQTTPAGAPSAASVAPGYLPDAVSVQTYPIAH